MRLSKTNFRFDKKHCQSLYRRRKRQDSSGKITLAQKIAVSSKNCKKVPFSCKACKFFSFSIKNYILHIRDIHLYQERCQSVEASLFGSDLAVVQDEEGYSKNSGSDQTCIEMVSLSADEAVKVPDKDFSQLSASPKNATDASIIQSSCDDISKSNVKSDKESEIPFNEHVTDNIEVAKNAFQNNSEKSEDIGILLSPITCTTKSSASSTSVISNTAKEVEQNHEISKIILGCTQETTSETPWKGNNKATAHNNEICNQKMIKDSSTANMVSPLCLNTISKPGTLISASDNRRISSKLENIVDSLKDNLKSQLFSKSKLAQSKLKLSNTIVRCSESTERVTEHQSKNILSVIEQTENQCNSDGMNFNENVFTHSSKLPNAIENAGVSTKPALQSNVVTAQCSTIALNQSKNHMYMPQHSCKETFHWNHGNLLISNKAHGNSHHQSSTCVPTTLEKLVSNNLVTMANTDILKTIDCIPNTWSILQVSFSEFPYPPMEQIVHLSNITKLTVAQVKTWFLGARLKHGISWSPDEVADAWSYIMKPSASKLIHQTSSEFQLPSKATNCGNVMYHAQQTLLEKPNTFPTYRSNLDQNTSGWIICHCGCTHRLLTSQYEILASFSKYDMQPNSKKMLQIQSIAGIPLCAALSFFQGNFKYQQPSTLITHPGACLATATYSSTSSVPLYYGNQVIKIPQQGQHSRPSSLPAPMMPVLNTEVKCNDLIDNRKNHTKGNRTFEQLRGLHQSFTVPPYLSEKERE